MIEKKIKKFYNSVPMQENMLSWAEESKENPFHFLWLAVSLFVGISIVIGVFLMMKDDSAASESD
jgi:hypothetical protein